MNLGSGAQPGRPRPLATPRLFNPLVPFADFGWLPPGSGAAHSGDVMAGQMWRSAEHLMTGPDTTLSVFAVGMCAWTRQYPVTGQILTCAPKGAAPGEAAVIRVTGRAPDVNGRPAYWGAGGQLAGGITSQPVRPMIAIQYARGGWALLQYPLRKYALRMARTARFGLHSPVQFGAQLRDGLPQWRVSFVSFTQDLSAFAEFEREFSVGRNDSEGFEGDSLIIGDSRQPGDLIQPGSPWLLVFRQPPRLASSCPFNAARNPSLLINGYRVAVRTTRGVPPTGGPFGWYQDVCTADADGLFVEVIVAGTHPPLTAVKIFRRLKLLGPDPVRWTTQPLP